MPNYTEYACPGMYSHATFHQFSRFTDIFISDALPLSILQFRSKIGKQISQQLQQIQGNISTLDYP